MAGIIKPLFYEPAKHIYKMFKVPGYFTWNLLESKLRKIPRFTDCRAKAHGWDLSMPDSASFLSAYEDIFLKGIYDFKADSSKPRILDLGANIGLSVLFFKTLYPEAQITAFEADPMIFEYLKKNVHGNGFTDVELINKAAWHKNAKLSFKSDRADGGRVTEAGDENIVGVDAIDMADYLKDKRFDFLKMDIEGAEESVLPACREHLSMIKFLFVEYHSRVAEKQSLSEIIGIMTEAGFRVHIHSVFSSPSPYVELKINDGFDLQLNIFGWKE